jgi:hypothetical protein
MDEFLTRVKDEFGRLQRFAEKALAQVRDDRTLHKALDAEGNSLAVLMQHVGGNLRSRFTAFLTTDGEKPDRDRDQEFVAHPERSRAELMEVWQRGWAALHQALGELTADDLGKTVTIRGGVHTVPEALLRALTHVAGHVGQMVFLAKHLEADHWTTLSVPRGRSRGVGPERKG